MSDGTTTIELRDDQHEALEERKRYPRESFKAVVDRLLEDNDGDAAPELHAGWSGKLSDDDDLAELQEQLDRIESSATTAEERTGEIEQTLEALRQ